MPEIDSQIWKTARLTIERAHSETDGTVFRLSGPFTARDIYADLSRDALREIFESATGDEQSRAQVFDLTGVPYMDSIGLGMLVTHYVRCLNRGIRLSITGLSPRVKELFRLTKVENVLPIAAI